MLSVIFRLAASLTFMMDDGAAADAAIASRALRLVWQVGHLHQPSSALNWSGRFAGICDMDVLRATLELICSSDFA